MSAPKDGGPAFPLPEHLTWSPYDTHGMSLRDYFAAKALNAIPFNPEDWNRSGGLSSRAIKATAQAAYEIADAMIAAREGEK